MTKTAINKCPICGGWVNLNSQVDVTYSLHEDDGELATEASDIINRVYAKAPIEAYCGECGEILDVIKVDSENFEFTFAKSEKERWNGVMPQNDDCYN